MGVINNTPAVLANSDTWRSRFEEAGLVLLGDDMKSLIGSTTFIRRCWKFFAIAGIDVGTTYHVNIGGNADFLNMRSAERAGAKRVTKSGALQDRLGDHFAFGIGPSDYIRI